jgi:hypothetical protein
VVAHYVNVDWQLEKRIIGLRMIDVSHNTENIAERITSVLADYGLTDKIFSVILDNAHIINLIVKAGLMCLDLCCLHLELLYHF